MQLTEDGARKRNFATFRLYRATVAAQHGRLVDRSGPAMGGGMAVVPADVTASLRSSISQPIHTTRTLSNVGRRVIPMPGTARSALGAAPLLHFVR